MKENTFRTHWDYFRPQGTRGKWLFVASHMTRPHLTSSHQQETTISLLPPPMSTKKPNYIEYRKRNLLYPHPAGMHSAIESKWNEELWRE